MAINHRYLAGKVINYTDSHWETGETLVVNVDKNIGITIVGKKIGILK